MEFNDLKKVPIQDIDLNDPVVVSNRIGIPVTRVTVYSIKGKIRRLPDEMHVYQCVIPSQCTADNKGTETLYYWMHNVEQSVLEPIRPLDAKKRIEQVFETLVVPEELSFNIIERRETKKERTVPKAAVSLEEYPSLESIAIDPELINNLPDEMVEVIGTRKYASAWYIKWKAKMMGQGSGYKQLYNDLFLMLTPDDMLQDPYLSYLKTGRYVIDPKIISDLDIATLGFSDVDLMGSK